MGIDENLQIFFDWIEGDGLEEICENPVIKIKHDTYGDIITYKDGTTKYISIGDWW